MASAALTAGKFRDVYGTPPLVVASAPGRVNLIGEHTDYNDGFVLPMAIDERAYAAVGTRTDDRSVVRSAQFDDHIELDAGDCDARPRSQWHDAARGILCEFYGLEREASPSASPVCNITIAHPAHVNVLFDSDVPRSAGLSSSAAVEMALARALCEAEGRQWVPLEMARLAQRVEHGYIGVRSGLMDQVVSAAAVAGTATLLDCRTFDVRRVAIPADVTVVIMDTGVRRTLSASEYNMRRAACESAVEVIALHEPGVRSLRDVTPALLRQFARDLTEQQHRRARHVVTENERVLAFAAAIEANEYGVAGSLLNASHTSLRDDYEVSSTHLDVICELARAHPSCHGARLTGAGFGGCAIALVQSAGADRFIAEVQPRYEASTYKQSRFLTARPADGARIDARTGTPGAPAAG